MAYMGLIWWLSDRQLPVGPEELLFPGADKLVHGVEYFILGWLWLWALTPFRWKSLGLALVLAAVWAGLDEWHQTWVPGRDGSLEDLAADMAGVLLAGINASGRRPRRTP